MAYTRIHAIRSTVEKAVAYICDASKTDEKVLVTSHACSPETAHHDFRFALSKTNAKDKVLAHHVIQSFAPGEVSPAEAHAIGVELADRLLGGRYSYVVTTHVNTHACHNHLIFCAADNISHKKFNNCKKTVHELRKISDQLCAEHGLSVIGIEGGNSEKVHSKNAHPEGAHFENTHFENAQSENAHSENVHSRKNDSVLWNSADDSMSWKRRIREDIDAAIAEAGSYREFLEIMRGKGYEVKGEVIRPEKVNEEWADMGPIPNQMATNSHSQNRGKNRSGNDSFNVANNSTGKYISFRPKGKERFVRGSEKGLGAEYTKERIAERIREKLSEKADFKFMTMEEFVKRRQYRLDPNRRFLSGNARNERSLFIDTSDEKFRKSPGLKKWAERQNLKTAAELFSENGSRREVQKEILRYRKLLQEAHATAKLLDQRIKELAEAVYYAQVYQENCTVHEQYRKSADKERFFREYEAEIVLFDGAKGYLRKVEALHSGTSVFSLFKRSSRISQKDSGKIAENLSDFGDSGYSMETGVSKNFGNFRRSVSTMISCNSEVSGNSGDSVNSGNDLNLEKRIQKELQDIQEQRHELQRLIDEVEQKIRAIEHNEKMVSKWVEQNLELQRPEHAGDRRNAGAVEQA